MKKILCILAGLVVAAICFARPDAASFKLDNVVSGSVFNASAQCGGWLEEVRVDVPAPATGWTGSCWFATVDGIFLNITNVTADATYRPRFQVNDNVGTKLGYASNEFAKAYFVNEPVTGYCVTTVSTSTNDVIFKFKLSNP